MAPKRILIIEDDLSVIASYLAIFETLHMDFIPLVATSYETAERMLLCEKVDLMILDLVLPDVTASEMLTGLRRRYPCVPILIVTGFPEELDRVKGIAAGIVVAGSFTKPFSPEVLCRTIEECISDQPRQ
ncbi:MAG: response regulator [bacterium]